MIQPFVYPSRPDENVGMGPKITVRYTNYRGVTAIRTVSPGGIWFGNTKWHPDMDWLLHCYDWDRKDWRDYRLKDCDFTAATDDGSHPSNAG